MIREAGRKTFTGAVANSAFFADVVDWARRHRIVVLHDAAINAKYARCHEMLAEVLRRAGFDARKPRGSFYLYAGAPRGTRDGMTFGSAEEFSEFLIRSKLISTVPWDDVEPGIRFSVAFQAGDAEEERRVIDEVGRRLDELGLVF